MQMRKTLAALLLIAIANYSTAAMALSTTAETEGIKMSDITEETKARAKAPLVEKYLLEGKLADGRIALEEQLRKVPTDDQARFGLGVLIFLDSVEKLKQSLYHYGLRNQPGLGSLVPFARLQVAVNPEPAIISYQDARKMVDDFRKGLMETDHQLAMIKSEDVTLPLHFGMIKLNFKDEHHPEGGEGLWSVYSRLTNGRNLDEDMAKAFYIKFDRGDVHWLRGYCHLLSALGEMYLAYDTKVLFEHTAHICFQRIDSPYEFLATGKKVYALYGTRRGIQHDMSGENEQRLGGEELDIIDAVAFLHLLNFKISEPERMQAALHHLEMVVSQSRESWKFIMAETGDDHEWLPNPRQTGVLPGIRVTDEMVLSWAKIMDQSEKLLKGEELIPFWRGKKGTGVNLRKVFLKPSDFDLVLWVQGTEAMPYLETGKLSEGEIWRQAQSTFGNQFPGFALWFN